LSFNHGLNPGDTITNAKLRSIFKCGSQGGMRRSRETNTLVIVSDHIKALYEDRWENDILHYTGMGLTGDQSLSFMQNKTLAQSQTNDVAVYLFEVFEKKSYTYIGQIELADPPYQEAQPDQNGDIRNVWVFPLKIVGEAKPLTLPDTIIQKKQQRKEKEASRLSDEDLLKRVRYARKGSGTRQVNTSVHERNPYVAELAKRRANGLCQLCQEQAPFNDKRGNPYLETHHIVWLSKGGEDAIGNIVALCPNCHRKMHSLNLTSDIRKLEECTSKDFISF